MFSVGKTYRTRSGDYVYISERRGDHLIGQCYGLTLQYHTDGKRFPRGGTDPFDLDPPVVRVAA